MAGGGSETQTSTIEIPQWLQEAAQSGLARGTQAAGIGYVPYRGPDVAALTPLQEAAMFNTSQASSAFGLGASPLPGAGMPTVQTFADGTRGYSAFPLYEQAVNDLKMRDPAQYAKLMAPFDGSGQFGITSMPMGGGAQSYGQPMQGYGSSRDYGNTAADRIAQGLGGVAGGGGLSSRLPGGVDTRNPNSLANRIAAGLTSRPQGAPTAANRPAGKSNSTSKPVSDSRTAAAGKTATRPATKPAEKKTSSTPSRGGVGRR
jgi:hypothetical protein